jgi:phosphatidylserine/phosphatidylglycerophosphate/cardiolipin synthase-like enzyme
MPRELLVLPEATAAPFLAAVAAAKQSLRLKMFVFTDPAMLAAVVAAKKRGVDVRVMLNPARRNGKDDNAKSRKALVAAGVTVRDSNPAFELTHEKSLVVDGSLACVMSLNWDTENLSQTRDYAVATTHRKTVGEIVECFDADWDRRKFTPPATSHLIWCNVNGRERFAHFIDGAKRTLWLQNERYQDAVIIERVVRAVERGVKVHVLARPPHTLKEDKLIEGVGGLRIMRDVGAKVHKLKGLKLHGKMMLADDARAIVGSVNLAPGSFDARRELAIEVTEPGVVKKLAKLAKADWKRSTPLDLTDEGLLADLAKRNEEGDASYLVLDVKAKKAGRKAGGKPPKKAAKRKASG